LLNKARQWLGGRKFENKYSKNDLGIAHQPWQTLKISDNFKQKTRGRGIKPWTEIVRLFWNHLKQLLNVF
jgi:hypothetical protein